MEVTVKCSNNENNKLELESLPNEVLNLILKLLGPNDLITCYNTSERLRNTVTICKLVFDILFVKLDFATKLKFLSK